MAQNNQDEIDLGYLFQKISNFFRSLAKLLFLGIAFFIKYIIVIVILILIGVAIGYYFDKNKNEVYNNEIIVIPNFGSVDYLYDKVEAINSKIASNDSIYLKQVLNTNFSKLNLIEIEPIVDFYNFISESRQNIDILRIISENQDFSDYVENIATSKYYKYHRMQISIKGKNDTEKIIDDLFKYFNDNEHFQEYQKIYKNTKDIEIRERYVMIGQLDSLIKANYKIHKEGTSVSVSNNADQYNLIEKKRQITDDLQRLHIQQNDYTVPIKKVSVNYNLEPEKLLNISNKVKYPLLLVFLFSLVFFIIYVFKKLKSYANAD